MCSFFPAEQLKGLYLSDSKTKAAHHVVAAIFFCPVIGSQHLPPHRPYSVSPAGTPIIPLFPVALISSPEFTDTLQVIQKPANLPLHQILGKVKQKLVPYCV